MAATRDDISRWFDEGVAEEATHMIIVCDDFDYQDYPVYVEPGEDVHEVVADNTGRNVQRLMEVYALHLDKASQMNESRAFHYESAPQALGA